MPSALSILKQNAKSPTQGMLGERAAHLATLSPHVPPGNDVAELIKKDWRMEIPRRQFSRVLCIFPSPSPRVEREGYLLIPSYHHLEPSERILRNSDNLISVPCSLCHLKNLKATDNPKRPLMTEQRERAVAEMPYTSNLTRKVFLWTM